jgi:hypothetical protein
MEQQLAYNAGFANAKKIYQEKVLEQSN